MSGIQHTRTERTLAGSGLYLAVLFRRLIARSLVKGTFLAALIGELNRRSFALIVHDNVDVLLTTYRNGRR